MEGVLPYMGYISMCSPKGYVFGLFWFENGHRFRFSPSQMLNETLGAKRGETAEIRKWKPFLVSCGYILEPYANFRRLKLGVNFYFRSKKGYGKLFGEYLPRGLLLFVVAVCFCRIISL